MIQDHEIRAQGKIQSFNVQGIFVAQGFPIKQVTVIDVGETYLLNLSGLIGNDSHGKLVEGGVHAQAAQTIKNIEIAITGAAHQLGVAIEKDQVLSHITFSRADVTDLTQVAELNRAYKETGMPWTSRAAIEVKALPLGAAVEITATAALHKK